MSAPEDPTIEQAVRILAYTLARVDHTHSEARDVEEAVATRWRKILAGQSGPTKDLDR